jgi:hypothetical protein
MPIRSLGKKIKLGKIRKTRMAPRWADIKKYGIKRARSRRVVVALKRWRRTRIRV